MAKRIMVALLALVLCFSSTFALTSCSTTKESFKVTFLAGADDAQLYRGETVQVVKNNAELDPPIFVRKGYNFDGWSVALGQINDDKTVWAMWTQYKFEVTFLGNGGVTADGEGKVIKMVSSGLDTVEVAPEFKKEGYVLSWDTELQLVSEKCVINAVWTPEEYVLSFKDKDGSQLDIENTTIRYDQTLSDLPELSDVEGEKPLRFTHWSNKNGMPYFNGMLWNLQKQDEEPFDLYANWTEDDYVISYDLNGGYPMQTPTSYSAGDSVRITNPLRKGYHFIGWTIGDSTQLNPSLTFDSETRGDKEIKANWEAEYYTFTLDYNGGNAIGSNKVYITYGQKVGHLKTPSRDNYEFIGWAYAGDSRLITEDTVWDVEPTIEQRVLVAQYRKIYTLKFSLTTRVYSTELTCVVTNVGDLKKLGINTPNDMQANISTFEIKIREGETLSDLGINVMPTVDPIEPSLGKPNGRGDDFYYNNDWKYSTRNQYGHEIILKVRPDTVFNLTNFEQVGEDGVVTIEPSCLSWYTH